MTDIDSHKIPRHIAIIMDGNGRWAKARQWPRTRGHAEGIKRVEEITESAQRLGVEVLTLYTFSTENWNRPKREVAMLMGMVKSVLGKKIDKLHKNNVKFQIIGEQAHISKSVLELFNKAIETTKNNTGLILNLAFNYGSRLEIVEAVKAISKQVKDGCLRIEDICEGTVSRSLYTRDLPDPDLLIRTSGELRISNYLLWQLSYAEFYFTDTYWPDFNEDALKKAIVDFQKRERRFGYSTAKQ